MTIRSYEKNTYLTEYESTVESILMIDGKYALIFSDTIFYPQGGGQPSDIGIIEIEDLTLSVVKVLNMEENIVHIIDSTNNEIMGLIGKKVKQMVDRSIRLTNAKLHTSGHLITNIIETIYPRATPSKGHHFPNQASVELTNCLEIDMTGMLNVVSEEILKVININKKIITETKNFDFIKEHRANLVNIIPRSKNIRVVQISGYKSLPCGGTHVNSTRELEGLTITKIKKKKDRLKISYTI